MDLADLGGGDAVSSAAPIRYLDVCSGYSAFTLASDGLPFHCVGYSEIEAFPRAILEQRHGAVPVGWDHRFAPHSNVTPLFGDFTKIEAHHVGPVDLLAGGTPCQAFSVAGKRLGLDDPRGNLTLEFLALARRLRVPWLAWENVPGFLSHDDGRTMGTFLRLLGELGYGFAYRVLDAQYIRVDGSERAVPQRRRRLFVIGHLGDAAGPAAVLFERESLRGNPAPRREAGQNIAPTISARTRGGGGLGTDFDCDGGLIAAEVTSTLPAGGNSTGGDRQPGTSAETAATMLVAHAFDARQRDVCQYGNLAPPLDTDGWTIGVAHALPPQASAEEQGGVADRARPEAVCVHADAIGRSGEALTPSIDAAGKARLRDAGLGISEGTAFGLTTGQPHAIAIQERAVCENPNAGPNGAGFKQDGSAYTLEARAVPQAVAYSIMPQNSCRDYKAREVDVAQPLMARGPVSGNQGGDLVAHPVVAGWAVRRLTPVECERLMAVPDGFTNITYRGKPAADGPRYKALGNSQARNNMRWLAHGLATVIFATSASDVAA
jgi:DNA (cytosine-5)-methyltransferase 1